MHYDLLSVVERDVPALAGTFNGRYTAEGPCPKCGGKTRFRLRLCTDGQYRAFCSHCAQKGLDAIGYIQWRDGVDFKTAKAFWEQGGAILSTRPVQDNWLLDSHPQSAKAPPEAWQKRARAFVEVCAEALWKEEGAQALAYLRDRGLADETIRRYKLGYNAHRRRGNPADWGLKTAQHVIAVPGIVIPREILGEMWAVNVRRLEQGVKPKYLSVTGSVLGLWGADDIRAGKPVMAFGGEFDAMLAAQYAPPGVACVTFGGEGHSVGEPWSTMLSSAAGIYICLDNDPAGDNGALKWLNLPRVSRVRVPFGKDLTEFCQQGGDVAAWIAQVTKAKERWLPPENMVERVELAKKLRHRLDSNDLSDDDFPVTLARWTVCAYGTKARTSDGMLWLDLCE